MRRARPCLGTYVEISVAAAPDASAAVEAAFAAAARVDALMSVQRQESELSRINREAAVRAVEVHPWTFEVLELASRLYRASGGLFDCAARTLRRPAGEHIILEPPGSVRYARPLYVDLGGIAKGYAVDRAVEALRAAGVARGMVNAGGDLRVFGSVPERIHVRLPEGGLLPVAEVEEGALATSSGESEPPCGLPILDRAGKTRYAARLASVLAESCAIADGLTKVVILAGAAAESALRQFAAEAAFLDGTGTWVSIARA